MVVDPGRTDDDRAAAADLSRAVVAALPPDARVALYALGPVTDPWAESVELVGGDTPWLVADAAAAPDDWRETRFERSGAFERAPASR